MAKKARFGEGGDNSWGQSQPSKCYNCGAAQPPPLWSMACTPAQPLPPNDPDELWTVDLIRTPVLNAHIRSDHR